MFSTLRNDGGRNREQHTKGGKDGLIKTII